MGWLKTAESAPNPSMVENKQDGFPPNAESGEETSKKTHGDDHPCIDHIRELSSIMRTVRGLEPNRNSKMIEIFSQWSSRHKGELEKMGVPMVPPFTAGGRAGFDAGEGHRIRSKIIALGKSWLTAAGDGRCTGHEDFVRSFDPLQATLGRIIAATERYSGRR